MSSGMTDTADGSQSPPATSRQPCPAHNHHPLTAPYQIRLLRLNSELEEGQIQCFLVRFDLQLLPRFEAISYTWGSGPAAYAIMCVGQQLQVRRNFFDVLVIFRCPDSLRNLWVDAVCINQEHGLEKSNQVQLMSRIYSNAARVFIWMGMNDTGNLMASLSHILYFVKCAIPESLQSDAFKAFGGLDEQLQAGTLKPPL